MMNQINFNQILIGIIFIILINACNKSSDPIVIDNSTDTLRVKSAYFKTDKDTIYRLGIISFEAKDTIGALNYRWKFGNGMPILSGYKTTHQFEKSGIYDVTLIINNLTYSKKIFVFPGMISYQVKNESKQNIEIKSYVANPVDYGCVRLNLNSGNMTDTIFSNSMFLGINKDLIAVHILIDNIEYINTPNIWVKSMQHHIIKLNDSSEFVKRFSNDNGPNIIVLGKL